jgi:LCP family protein required for cell wall assembly
MRYVDIGTLPNQNSTNFRRGATPSRSKKKSGRKLFKTASWLLLSGVLLFGVYSILPPIKDAVGSMLGGSSTVFHYLVNGKQELKQDGGKTNVLLMGIDKRADEDYENRGPGGIISKSPFRTDSMIIASYNHDSKKATMLSIPRDMLVDVPAFGEVNAQSMKINGVYAIGDMYGYPGGGQALLTKVLSNVLAIPIHYSARIDFAGFEKAIDAVGGVDVMVENAIYPE